MASVTGVMPKKKAGKRRVAHVRVERAQNGYTVTHRMEPQTTRKPGGMMMSDYEPEQAPAVFSGNKAHKQMLAHVGDLMSQGGDDQEGAPDGSMPGAA